MSQKLFDNVWKDGSQAFSYLFGKDPVFYRMMSPFYVQSNIEINSLGFPGIPASVENYGKVLQFVIQKHRSIDSMVNSYFQQPEVKNALLLFTDVNSFGVPTYFGSTAGLDETSKIFVQYFPTEYLVRAAMRYGFLHYAIEPASSVYKKFLIDEPEVSFRGTNPIEHFQLAFSSVASGYLTAIGPEGIAQTFSGFGKPIASQDWNPVHATLQIANSFEGLITGAVIVGATAATGTLGTATAEAAAAAPAATTGTTVAEIAVTTGAPAATGGGGVLSTIGTWASENAAAAITTATASAGAALESEAKKRVKDAIVGALQPQPDAAPGGSGVSAPEESAGPIQGIEEKKSIGYLFVLALAGLAYFTT